MASTASMLEPARAQRLRPRAGVLGMSPSNAMPAPHQLQPAHSMLHQHAAAAAFHQLAPVAKGPPGNGSAAARQRAAWGWPAAVARAAATSLLQQPAGAAPSRQGALIQPAASAWFQRMRCQGSAAQERQGATPPALAPPLTAQSDIPQQHQQRGPPLARQAHLLTTLQPLPAAACILQGNPAVTASNTVRQAPACMEAPSSEPQGSGQAADQLTSLLSSGPNDRVEVQCNGMPGTLLITTQAIVCKCAECQKQPSAPQAGMGGRVMTPTEFERHSGMCSSKKWRRSIKVVIPNGRGGRAAVSVGRWLEQHGYSVQDKKEDRRENLRERGGGGGRGQGRDRDREREDTETEGEPDAPMRPPMEPFYFMRPTMPPAFVMHQHAAAAAAAAALMQPHAAAAMALFGGCAPPPAAYEESDDSEAVRPPPGWPPMVPPVMPGHSPASVGREGGRSAQKGGSGTPAGAATASAAKRAKRSSEHNNDDVLAAANALGMLKSTNHSGSSASQQQHGASSGEEGGQGSTRNGPRGAREAMKAEHTPQQNSGSSRQHAASPQQPSSAKAGRQSSAKAPATGGKGRQAEHGEQGGSPHATPAKQPGSAKRGAAAPSATPGSWPVKSRATADQGRRTGAGHEDADASNSESDSAARHAGTSSGVHGSGGAGGVAHVRGMRSMFPMGAGMPPFGMPYAHPGFMPMMYDPLRASMQQQQQQMMEMAGRAAHHMAKSAAAGQAAAAGSGSAQRKGRATGSVKRKLEQEEPADEDEGGEGEAGYEIGEEDEDDSTPLAAHVLGHGAAAGFMPGRMPMMPPGAPMFMFPHAAAIAGARKMYGGAMGMDEKLGSPAAAAAAAAAMGMGMGMGMNMGMGMGMGNMHQRGVGGFPMMVPPMMMQPGMMGPGAGMPMPYGRRGHGAGGSSIRRGRAAPMDGHGVAQGGDDGEGEDAE